jgi:HEPN domain-containing protein
MDNVVTEWLKFSDTDFSTADYLYNNMQPAPLEIICYHCQQSAEKALKAFLIYSNFKPEKTHNLELLIDGCIK